jgi:Membrane protein involved in the export of O-antigen and teichoic acid
MTDRYKKLLGNSVLFAVGNFGSRILLVLLVPFYTHFLSTAEYGTIDLITTSLTLLLPIISVSINEAVFRFVMDKGESAQAVVTNALAINAFGILISLFLYPLAQVYIDTHGLVIILYIILAVDSVQVIMAQYTRAAGKIMTYAVNGVIKTFVLGITNILLLAVLHLGVIGYFYSILISSIFSILLFLVTTDIVSKIRFKMMDSRLMRRMLVYAIPLIPNSLMWWLINASSRFFIVSYHGIEVNGIYAVASRIPAILTLFSSVFIQSWQMSAIEESDSSDRENFYSKVYSYYQLILFATTSALLIIIKPLSAAAFAADYYGSWKYVPFLLLSVVFSSLSGYLGANYLVAKETKGVFQTSIIGGFLSIVLNFLLIPYMGGVGAGLSAFVCFLVMWILRVYDTKKYIKIRNDPRIFLFSILIIFIQMLIVYMDLNLMIEMFLSSVLFIVLLIIHRKNICELLNKFLKKLKVAS